MASTDALREKAGNAIGGPALLAIAPVRDRTRLPKGTAMLRWALIFLVISLIAALFGFTGISVAAADIARTLFFIFIVIFIVLLLGGLMAGRGIFGL